MHSNRRLRQVAASALLAGAVVALPACGSSSSTKSSGSSHAVPLALTISEAGKAATYTAPRSTTGGLVSISLTNRGKAPHGAQLALIEGNHSAQEALQSIAGSSNSAPEWLRAEGGVSTVAPGQTGSATVMLPAGRYVLVDVGGGQQSGGPPAHSPLTVTPPSGSAAAAALPGAPATVTAASLGPDRYRWQVNGTLKAGMNRIVFDSKGGSKTLHVISAFRLTGSASKSQIIGALKSGGPPPSFVDQSSSTSSAALDGGKSEVASLTFTKPGRYVFFCPLADRDGGKPHFMEGMLDTVIVK